MKEDSSFYIKRVQKCKKVKDKDQEILNENTISIKASEVYWVEIDKNDLIELNLNLNYSIINDNIEGDKIFEDKDDHTSIKISSEISMSGIQKTIMKNISNRTKVGIRLHPYKDISELATFFE